jgi:hypothetical protein
MNAIRKPSPYGEGFFIPAELPPGILYADILRPEKIVVESIRGMHTNTG